MTSSSAWRTAIADAAVAVETCRRIGLGVSVGSNATTEVQMSARHDGRIEIWERQTNGRTLRTDFRDSALTGRLLKVAIKIDDALKRQRPSYMTWDVSDPEVIDALEPLVGMLETLGTIAEAIESLHHVTVSKDILEGEIRSGKIPVNELVDALRRVGERAATLREADQTLLPLIDELDANAEAIVHDAVLRWAAAVARNQVIAASTSSGAPVVEEARIRLLAARTRAHAYGRG